MNGYLLIAACTFDDVPIEMYDNEQEARDNAARLTQEDIPDLFSIGGVSDYVCPVIVTFVSGKITNCERLQRREDA